MPFGVYIAIDGTDEEIEDIASKISVMRQRPLVQTMTTREWVTSVLMDVIDEFLRNAAALEARQKFPKPDKLTFDKVRNLPPRVNPG